MSITGPTEQHGGTTYGTTEQYDATAEQFGSGQRRWEQPSFGTPDPTVSGPVLTGMAWTGQSRPPVAPPSTEEDRLRTIVRLIWPIALVLAVLTGHWLPLLVGTIIVGGVLRRRLLHLRYQRMTSAPSLR